MAGCRTVYSSICGDMASRGFLVAAVEHRDGSATWTQWNDPKTLKFEEIPIGYRKIPENEAEFSIRNIQVQHRASECLRTLKLMKVLNEGKLLQLNDTKLIKDSNFDWNQFKGKIDLTNCAIAGQSFGGSTTVQVLTEQNDFKCGVSLDSWMVPIKGKVSLQKPTFFLCTEWQWKRNFDRIKEIAQLKYPIYTLKGSVHQSQCDWTFLVKGYWGKKYKCIGEGNPLILHKINCDLMACFIKEQLELKGEPTLESVLIRNEEWLSQGFYKSAL